MASRLIILIAAMFFITGCDNTPRLPTTPKLGYKDKSPVGGSILHTIVNEYYNVLNYNNHSFEDWSNYQLPYDSLPSDYMYIAAAPTINMLDEEADKLLRIVEKGSSAVLMADRFSENLLRKLNITHNDEVISYSTYQ